MKAYFIYVLLILVFASCKKKDDIVENPSPTNTDINGKIQKGPYSNGSSVIVFELNSSLGQTGMSFSTTTSDDAGNFSLSNISLSSNYVLITANGYYFMEHFNLVSPNQLYLEAISDVQSSSTINVNLLTHLIRPRIEKLVSDGAGFSAARTQAQNELKSFLNVPGINNTNFDALDISNDAFLFAASLLFQRRTANYTTAYNYTSELTGLMNRFRNDFRDNGLIDSQDIIDTLLYNANRIQLIDSRSNLETYLGSLGNTVSVSGYEEYIYAFQNAYSSQVYSTVEYPDSAIYDTDSGNPTLMRNILHEPSVNFIGGGRPYLLAANVPFDTSLVIRFTLLSTGPLEYSVGQPYYGWYRTTFSDGFEVEAQRKNFQNALMLYLWGTSATDSARVDYYLNDQTTPYISKIIYW